MSMTNQEWEAGLNDLKNLMLVNETKSNARLEKLEKLIESNDKKWDARFESTEKQWDARFGVAEQQWHAQFAAAGKEWDARFEKFMTRVEDAQLVTQRIFQESERKWEARFDRLDSAVEVHLEEIARLNAAMTSLVATIDNFIQGRGPNGQKAT